MNIRAPQADTAARRNSGFAGRLWYLAWKACDLFLVAMSSILFLCVVVMWVRSRFVADQWAVIEQGPDESGIYEQARVRAMQSMAGEISLGWTTLPLPVMSGQTNPPPMKPAAFLHSTGHVEGTLATGIAYPHSIWNRLGFASGKHDSFGDYSFIIVPYWSLAVLTAILPGTAIIRGTRGRRIARRIRDGLCRNCGYDLRASESRCPECGTPINQAAPSNPSC